LLTLDVYDVIVCIIPNRVLRVSVVVLKGKLLAGEAIVVGVEALINLPSARQQRPIYGTNG
jgi:hypothetical protein